MAITRDHSGVAGEWQHASCAGGRKIALCVLVSTLALLCWVSQAIAGGQAEYQVKAAFLINFVSFTEWPAEVGSPLNLCVYGPDSFGADLDPYQNRRIGVRSLVVTRVNGVDDLGDCQIVFITRPVIDNLQRVLDTLRGKPVLTVADSPGAMLQGVILNMGTKQGKVNFEANLAAARGNRLSLSSKLLNLASEVKQ